MPALAVVVIGALAAGAAVWLGRRPKPERSAASGAGPTGGVSAANAPDYLALSIVLCVGGSWIAPEEMMRQGDWAGIEALARQAAGLRP